MAERPLAREAFVRGMADVGVDVSRETLASLTRYLELLGRWQRAINLVGASTLADPWRRHILDCAQIAPHVPGTAQTVLDLGSGAGLPGLVLALLGRSRACIWSRATSARRSSCARPPVSPRRRS